MDTGHKRPSGLFCSPAYTKSGIDPIIFGTYVRKLENLLTQETSYRKTVAQLRQAASLFWPAELAAEASRMSVVPLLLETQDAFLSLLGFPLSHPGRLQEIIDAADLPANLIVKHLMVLTDFGGEKLQRVNDNFALLFPDGELEYAWQGQNFAYSFQVLPVNGRLSNQRLGVDGKHLAKPKVLDDLLTDVIMLLVFGGASRNENTASVLAACEVSEYLGRAEELRTFVKQRYIWVSRITTGSRTNTLGQLAQQFVYQFLQTQLRLSDVLLTTGGSLPGISHDEQNERLTSFDIVVQRGEKYVAVEVSFQVTTNSVIERKAGQARARFHQIDGAGYRIAYVLDGAGNFQRENALSTICAHSHCTVAFSRAELEVLCQFIREYFT